MPGGIAPYEERRAQMTIEREPKDGKPLEGARGARPKRTRNAVRTRAELLEVAEQEFAAKGFAGARVDEIVRRCGVTKNVLYHYFQSKEILFVEVMELAYARMRHHQSEWSLAHLDPEKAVSSLTLFTFEHFRKNPNIIQLLNSENLYKAKHISMSEKIPSLYDPLMASIRDILDRGQESGRFRRDVDPIDLYITISGISYFYLSNQYTLGYALQRDLMAPERLKQREKHMVDVILGYLRV